MKLVLLLCTFALAGCSNITPAQQANIDKAVATGLKIAVDRLDKPQGLAK